MKRGRPSIRKQVKESILEVLSSSQIPMTISGMVKYISKKLNRKISWNTVEKYVKELIETNKIQAIVLPHSKDETKKGLTVYILKR